MNVTSVPRLSTNETVVAGLNCWSVGDTMKASRGHTLRYCIHGRLSINQLLVIIMIDSDSGRHGDTKEEDKRRRRRGRREDDTDDDDSQVRKRDRKKRRKREDDRKKRRKRGDDGSSDSEDYRRRRRKKRQKKSSSRKRSKSKKERKRYSSSSSDSDDSSDDSSAGSAAPKSKVLNEKLLAKLNARGETLEERKERRAQKRAAKIQSRFGYTAEDNPFNDPNIHETFTWTKKKEKAPDSAKQTADTLEEIDNIRNRRKEREAERDEMERLRAEESRMKELENYDEWARKEEEFHLEQQRKRSAIRLVEGREKPIDILAKNLLLFGLTEEEKQRRAAVKYQERYNALDHLEKLHAELQEPHKIVKVLKLMELQELLLDINTFRLLEKEGMSGDSKSTILCYWDALHGVAQDEIKFLQNGGVDSPYARKVDGIKEIFKEQSRSDLLKMKDEIEVKLKSSRRNEGGSIDITYWQSVREQLMVHLAKLDLSEIHSKMLVRQLERLEQRKQELAERQNDRSKQKEEEEDNAREASMDAVVPKNVEPGFGNQEDELGVTDEVDLLAKKAYSWQDRYAPRKPRYFNRVKTGYDWNKYNQTHYDHDNPPPKTVQGYKFNIFYPELVDPTKTPQFFLEPADSEDFCILRFHAGPPYEDVAFKIINREWNRSRKRGYRCTFERGILSLYFNFTTHWYRR